MNIGARALKCLFNLNLVGLDSKSLNSKYNYVYGWMKQEDDWSHDVLEIVWTISLDISRKIARQLTFSV